MGWGSAKVTKGLRGHGTLMAGESLEGPCMKVPLLSLEATSHCELAWYMERDSPRVYAGHKPCRGICFGPWNGGHKPLAMQENNSCSSTP